VNAKAQNVIAQKIKNGMIILFAHAKSKNKSNAQSTINMIRKSVLVCVNVFVLKDMS
jgi:hypothetical protein